MASSQRKAGRDQGLALWLPITVGMACPAHPVHSRDQSYPVSNSWRSEWLTRVQRWDPVTFILLAHAGVLVVLDRVLHPGAGALAAVGFGAWRVGLGFPTRRSSGVRRDGWDLFREGGSLLLAAALTAADGGTESPFFFWTVILLAWEAMVYPLRTYARLVALALAAYVVMAVGVSDVRPASIARLGLLASFCAVLGIGRLRVDHHQRVAVRADRLLQDAFGVAPVGLAVIADPYRVVFANAAARELGLGEVLATGEEGGEGVRRFVDQARERQRAVGPELFVFHPKDADVRHLRVLATPHGPSLSRSRASRLPSGRVVGAESTANCFRTLAGRQPTSPAAASVARPPSWRRSTLTSKRPTDARQRETDRNETQAHSKVTLAASASCSPFGDVTAIRRTVGSVRDQTGEGAPIASAVSAPPA
jgi:hypothetical protein